MRSSEEMVRDGYEETVNQKPSYQSRWKDIPTSIPEPGIGFTTSASYDIEEIMALSPHEVPFLGITNVEKVRKQISLEQDIHERYARKVLPFYGAFKESLGI